MNQFVKEYAESKVIVVCRGIAEEEIVNVAQAMYDGGIRFMEVPFNQADPSSFASTAVFYEGDLGFLCEIILIKWKIGLDKLSRMG